MDQDTCRTISKIIVKLSTAGKTEVDPKGVKDLVHYAGKSEEYLKFTHEKLLKQLKKKHSEIRLGVFLIIEAFFKKSAFYRELFLDEFRTILDLTVGSNSATSSLPPPLEAAELLKLRTLNAFHKWQEKFSKTHPRLPIAYNYIKSVLKIDFGDQLKLNLEEARAAQEQREHVERSKASHLEALQQDIQDHQEEISNLILEIRNCINLIIPKPEEFMGANEKLHSDKIADDIDMREHGFTAPISISIELSHRHRADIVVTEDNDAAIETLKGLYLRAKNRYCPMLTQWLRMARKCGDDEQLKTVVKMKEDLESEVARYGELNLIPSAYKASDLSNYECRNSDDDEDDDDDDEDFEDVPEKHGYEEFAIAPPVVPKHILSDAKRNHPHPSATTTSTATSWNIIQPLKSDELHDPTYGMKPPLMKQLLSVSAASISAPKSEKAASQEVGDRKSKLLSIAPKLPFDVDLYHWEDTDLHAPSIEVADTGVHRFWQPLDREGETIENPDGVAALRTRKIEFSGTFVPIEWSCRAPLPSGNLCPRKDREKCPFHGRIIPRDENGNPTNEEDAIRLKVEREKTEQAKPPDWQDPKFLKDLQAEIGMDLTIRASKRGGKSFADKYPQLTDVRKLKDDPRKRLEKKIFNKKSLKRVATALDAANAKKFRDKFGDQFNYTG
ncbi:unnamed protein product [Allacma fusca]|uniref:UV-stimulated scaffold protein A C-terminal domain-containing protein n=1 Tax=Allacma fusca TaxID=39272 RepID=A0A8J2NVB7_9HEXA|nr:unnamed protein product [Allacma fusca]